MFYIEQEERDAALQRLLHLIGVVKVSTEHGAEHREEVVFNPSKGTSLREIGKW